MPGIRKFKPFGLPKTPFNPITGMYQPLIPDGLICELATVEAINGDEGEDSDYDYVLTTRGKVYKPHILKQTPFDGETVNGIAYVYSEDGLTRTATKESISEVQRITPDYYIGEELLCIKRNSFWQDVNSAGREWVADTEEEEEEGGIGSRHKTVVVTAINDNTIEYEIGDPSAPVTAAAYRPYLLRKLPFDGETVDGITYTYSGFGETQERSATDGSDTETQVVTPPYYIGEEIIVAEFISRELVGDSYVRTAFWIDLNSGGRCWAVKNDT